MAEASYPYTGGQGVTDAVYEQLMAEVTGNGRINLRAAGQSLTVPLMYADGSGRQVKFRANASYLIRGFRWDSNEGHVRSLDPNTSGNPRLDLGVLRLDRSDFTVRLAILKGTPAATPTLPAVTQQLGPNGRYEIPLGAARVANNATNILSSDITSLETWHSVPNQIGHSSQKPITVDPGAFWTEYDTGRVYAGLQSTWQLIGERTSFQQISPAGGWDPDKDNVYVQRVNGMTYFQALVYRPSSGTGAAVAQNVDVRLTTIPEYYRPNNTFNFIGSMSGGSPVRGSIEAATGYVTVFDHAALAAGSFVHVGPFAYPSRV